MPVGLDTSVVLRLLTGQPAEQAQYALAFLDDLRAKSESAEVCDIVLLETYFALCHHYNISKEQALASLRSFVSTGEIRCSKAASEVLDTPTLHSAKPGFADRLIHAHYAATAGQMATFERAAAKLPAVTVLGL